MIPEPQALADALFGSSDGAEPDLVKAAALALDLRRTALAAEVDRSKIEPVHHFRAEFSGKHLHRFLCFLLERLPQVNDWETCFELQLATILLGSNYFTRWIRTAPAHTIELLFVRVVEHWSRNCPDLTTLFEGPRTMNNVLLGSRNEQYTASLFYAQTLSLIVVYIPFEIDLRSSSLFSSPATLPALGRDFETLTRKCSRILDARRTDDVLRGTIQSMMRAPEVGMEIIVRYLLHPEKSAREVREHFHSRPDWSISWYGCAARPFGGEDCLKSAGGEMMACGRCQTVQYCCKDHQREHWTAHKSRCFSVEWDFS